MWLLCSHYLPFSVIMYFVRNKFSLFFFFPSYWHHRLSFCHSLSHGFNFSPHQRDIAEGLLRMLSQILMQRPIPSRAGAPPPPPSPDHQDTASIVLALRTLGSFDFEGTGKGSSEEGVGERERRIHYIS